MLSGASPEMRRRLVQTVRSIVGDDEPECPGVLEVSGVRLALDRSTLDQLRLDHRIDPVLALRDPLPGATDAPTPAPATATAVQEPLAAGSGSEPNVMVCFYPLGPVAGQAGSLHARARRSRSSRSKGFSSIPAT